MGMMNPDTELRPSIVSLDRANSHQIQHRQSTLDKRARSWYPVTRLLASSLSENRVNVGVRYHWYGFVKSHAGKG